MDTNLVFLLEELKTRSGVIWGNYGGNPNTNSTPASTNAPVRISWLIDESTAPPSMWLKKSDGVWASIGTDIASSIAAANQILNATQQVLNDAELARDATYSAAQSSGVYIYDTKALATAAVAGLADLAIVEVLADESQSGARTRYRKESGSLVFKIALEQFLQFGTGAVARTAQGKMRDVVSVKDFGAVGDGVTNDAPAIQSAVDYAISSGVKRIFIPFSSGERYRLSSTVVMLCDDFAITGDHAPIRQSAGYIFGDAGVDALFDYGGGVGHPELVGAFVCDGVNFYGKANVDTGNYLSQPRAIKFTQPLSGPTRHMLFRNVTANNFYDAFYFDNPSAGTLAGATVTFDGCYTRNNANSAVYANKRILGLRYVGNLSESGGQIKGQLHGGVSITDNMLEGSVDTIDVTGTGPSQMLLERNYFEANRGNFVCRFKPTNIGSSLTIGDNFFGGGAGLSNYDDFVYVGGGTTLVENNTAGTVDFALSTIEATWFRSRLHGKFHMPVDSGVSTRILCDAAAHIGKKPSTATLVRVIGFDEIETPFGKTKNGLINSGSALGGVGASQSVSYSAGDLIVAVALIKCDAGSLPRMIVRDQASANLPADTGNFTTSGIPVPDNIGGEWQLWCYAFPAVRAGTGLRFQFGAGVAGKSVYVAAYGYEVISAANFFTTTYGSKTRAKVQLWTPFHFLTAELDGSKTHDWPDLATATTQSTTVTVTGAALGDYAEASMSVALGGTRLWAEVTATDTVTVYQRNDTGGNVNVASGAMRVRVRKA